MTRYVDSSALVAVYVTERFSKPARRALRAVPQVPYTQLHEVEVPNAFELLVGRAVMTREECRTIRVQLHDDIENQRLVRFTESRLLAFNWHCPISLRMRRRELPPWRSCLASHAFGLLA